MFSSRDGVGVFLFAGFILGYGLFIGLVTIFLSILFFVSGFWVERVFYFFVIDFVGFLCFFLFFSFSSFFFFFFLHFIFSFFCFFPSISISFFLVFLFTFFPFFWYVLIMVFLFLNGSIKNTIFLNFDNWYRWVHVICIVVFLFFGSIENTILLKDLRGDEEACLV
jgi:hypothetical protein